MLQAYALPLADEAYKTFSARYGFTPSGPILVESFRCTTTSPCARSGLPGLVGALGACFGRVVTMDSPRARPPGDFSWQATLWHELAHVFTLQLSNYRVPRWLTEGISVYEEHRRQPAWGRELTLEFARQLSEGQDVRREGPARRVQAAREPALAYFEASLVVEHLVELQRRRRAADAAPRVRRRRHRRGGVRQGRSARAWTRSRRRSRRSSTKRYGALSAAHGRSAVGGRAGRPRRARRRAPRRRPGNFVSQLALGQALLKRATRPARPRPARTRGRAGAAGAPATPARAPARGIAEKAGDPARARRELRQLLPYDHTNVDAARRLAALAAQAKATDDENFALRMVADLDPFDADTHGLLGRRLLGEERRRRPRRVPGGARPGPANLAEAHTDFAEALFKLGRKDEARHARAAGAQGGADVRARAGPPACSITGR